MHESRERKSEQALKELKDLKSQMMGVRRGRSCPLGSGEMSISSSHCDRTTDMSWGAGSPTPGALLERLGLGETWPWGTRTHWVPHQSARLEGQSAFTFVLPHTGVTLWPV